MKKTNSYQVWPRNERNQNTISITDRVAHARNRKVLNLAFSEKAIQSAEAFVIQNVDRWNEILVDGRDGWSGPMNVAQIANRLSLDIAGNLAFGTSFNLKEPGGGPFKEIPATISMFLKFMYPVYSNHTDRCPDR